MQKLEDAQRLAQEAERHACESKVAYELQVSWALCDGSGAMPGECMGLSYWQTKQLESDHRTRLAAESEQMVKELSNVKAQLFFNARCDELEELQRVRLCRSATLLHVACLGGASAGLDKAARAVRV